MGMMARRNKVYKVAIKAAKMASIMKSIKPVEKKVEEVKEEVKEEAKEEVKAEKTYSKSDIATMTVANLKVLAKEQGIENADSLTGKELKNKLVEKMGL